MTFVRKTCLCKFCGDIFAGYPVQDYCSIGCRFWAKVNIGTLDQCWEWQAVRTVKGYGLFLIDNKNVRSHKVAWEFNYGTITDKNLNVLHSCDNPPCCNPLHLFLGTNLDNIKDMIQKKRHPHIKLNTNDIHHIRRLLTKGLAPKQIADKYSVHVTAIYKIRSKTNWGFVIQEKGINDGVYILPRMWG